ncbi:MAG: hypothetical protein Q8P22_14280, partial [Chloroflexota bacterium]|nr:hypothetical protein [Chloroflexota bacterium]
MSKQPPSAGSGQVPDPLRLAAAIAKSPFVPGAISLELFYLEVALLRRRILRQDRRQAVAAGKAPNAPAEAVYCIDGYHGGVTFWDWLALPGGGFWYAYCWNLVGRILLERAGARPFASLKASPALHSVFDVDAHTYEHMARRQPAAIAQLRKAVEAGTIEVVNGTYGQPLCQTVSGEAIVRHFYYGLAAIEKTLGVRVESFLSQEPLFFPQLPQVLAGFRFQRAVLRTHWAPFGSDPAEDATLVRWRGPDGSEMPTVPRYRFTDYSWKRPDHRGLEKGGLAGADLVRWGEEDVTAFRRQAEAHGIGQPLVSRVADFHVVDPACPDAPLANAVSLAGQGLRFVTAKEYFDLAENDGPVVTYSLDQMPAAIPWGLEGERLLKARTEAEGRLLVAERLDAIAHALGGPSDEAKLNRAWKKLLLAQHHDLHVCAPWLSRRHGQPMGAVGRDLAVAATQAADAVAETALRYLASLLDTSSVKGQPLVVFNPSPWPRREYVQAAGRVIDLPPLGYRVVDGREGGTAPGETDKHPVYSTEVRPDGSFCLKKDGELILDGGGYLTVWKDGRWHDSRQSVACVRLV